MDYKNYKGVHFCSILMQIFFRQILRDEGLLSLLLQQLHSSSLTIVSNSSGTLWNFSARSATDQAILWELGAVPMLQSLSHSKHKTISTCSLAAVKNLQAGKPLGHISNINQTEKSGLLTARKTRHIVEDLQSKMSESVEHDTEESSESNSISENESESHCF